MQKEYVYIKAKKEEYSPIDLSSTMTVGELIEYLQNFNKDTKICIDNDNGYTYGAIRECRIAKDLFDDYED